MAEERADNAHVDGAREGRVGAMIAEERMGMGENATGWTASEVVMERDGC